MACRVEKHNLILQWLTVVFGALWGLTFNQWISLGVLVTGFITMLVNWHYKKLNMALEREKFHEELKARLRQQQRESHHE